LKILTRYILREHVGPFLFGIAGIVFVFLLNIVFRDLGKILGKGLPAGVVGAFFFYNLAWILALAVPMAVLIASLMAFGRLSSDREIDAIKASAVPVHRLMLPVFLAAAVLAGGMVYFNDTVLPEFNHRVKRLYYDISRTRPMISLDPNVFYRDIPNYTILVKSIDHGKNTLAEVLIHDVSDPRFNKTIVAERGRLDFYKAQERIVFTLFNGEVHEVEKGKVEEYRRMHFERQAISISVPDMFLSGGSSVQRGDREKSSAMLRDDIREDANVLREREGTLRRLVKWDWLELLPAEYRGAFGDAGEQRPFYYSADPASRAGRMRDQTEGEAKVIQGYRRSINSLWVEVHKKLSIPFASLVFVLIGAPLGILVRQSGFAAAGWLSILFFLVYWTFLIGGEQLADRRILGPAVAMWAPNLLTGGFGILLFLRTLKESTLFPWARLARRARRGGAA
jgi:lipopolysaccharide export system permease protein